jgi:hypothetical protein
VLPRSSQLAAGGESCPQNGYYPVRFGGYEGWAYGAHLRTTGTGTLESALSHANTRDDAIARARTGVGFSYWFYRDGTWYLRNSWRLPASSFQNGQERFS